MAFLPTSAPYSHPSLPHIENLSPVHHSATQLSVQPLLSNSAVCLQAFLNKC